MNGKSAVKVTSHHPTSSQSPHPSCSIHSPMHQQPDLKLLTHSTQVSNQSRFYLFINRKYLKFESTFPGINQQFDNHTPFLKYNKRSLIKIFLKTTPKNAGVHATYPQLPDNHSTHSIEMAKEEGAYKLLTQLPVLYLILRERAGVDAGVGRAYGVRDF